MYFVLKNKENTKYVAIDFSSGGYPCLFGNLSYAKIFKNIDDVIEYREHFPKYDIYQIEIKETSVKLD